MSIPATHTEIEQLYLAAEINGHKSICITSCHSGDGVTSVAAALTERYMLAGHSALYVDLNLFNPAFKDLELFHGLTDQDKQQQPLIEHIDTHQTFVGVPAPTQASTLLAYKDPTTLRNEVTQWLGHYDRVIIDTSPLLNVNKGNIPAQSVASACEATIVVVAYGETSAHHLVQGKGLLTAQSVNILGSVFNMKNTPSFTQELVRQLNKVKFLPNKWREKVAVRLYQNEFLNLPL
ncbi:chromosome partitioning protein ParA [Vibrio makurazakiensis]|uniref:chromosome partitioning protein ParA n=1 Tax=Vibrio makurazakiensis TaxID=2910250 RepID=UPI003D110293